MSVDPPHLSPGTEVSAKYKGAFCEAKIKKCQKTVKCKVSPKDGGPQISVADDAIQGSLKIGGLVKVRQPDSGQLIDGTISRIIDSSVYTVVFDDGDVATLKRTQICLKGDKHYMEGDTLDKLPLTNPEHFSTPVNLLKKERRRRSGIMSNQSSMVLSDDSDEEVISTSRRISPRGNSRQTLDEIGKVVSLCDKKKWAPALVIRPSNHEADMKSKGLIMVKSFRDSKIYTVTEKQLREFTRESVRAYSDDKLTKAALDKAYKYTMSKELPASWKREEILSPNEPAKKSATSASTASSSGTSTSPTAAPSVIASKTAAESEEDVSSSSEEEEEKSDMFLAQLYKFMDDRNTPINKPAQLYNRDVNLSRLFQKIRRLGGFNKVSATGKWKSVAKKLGFTGISAGTEMKLLYRRYLCAFEDFSRKMGDTHMFEGTRSQRSGVTGGRHVLPPRDRESHAEQKAVGKPGAETADKKSAAPIDKSPPLPVVEDRSSPAPSGEKKMTSSQTVEKKTVPVVAEKKTTSALPAEKKVTQAASESKVETEEALRRTPLRHASKKEDKGKVTESPRKADNSAKGRGGTPSKANIKVEKAAKLDLDLVKDNESKASTPSKAPRSPTPPSPEPPASKHKELMKPKEEPTEAKNDTDSVMSDDESLGTVNVEVDYPPGTKVKVRYGRARNVKMYDAKVTEIKLGNDKQLLYSVHYAGWNQRYDEVIPGERIVGVTGKCEKRRMDILRAGFGPGRLKKQKSTSQTVTSASSTGSRTPEPLPASKCAPAVTKNSTNGAKLVKTTSANVSPALPGVANNRTTRSSAIEDLGLTRPTRSKSVDSNMSSGRKPRLKRAPLAESEAKREPDEPDAETDSTDEESKESTSCDLQPAAGPMEGFDRELNKPDASASSGDRAPRRVARRASKLYVPADESSVQKTSSAEVLTTPTSAAEQTEQPDMVCDVAEGAEGETTTTKETELSEKEECPAAKRAKVERDGSPGSVPCEEAFVKIEPLKHKKHQVRAEKVTEKEDVDEQTDMVLPPLMSRSSKAPSIDSESKTSAVSSLAEESEASCSSDYESKSPNNVCEQSGPAVTQPMHAATSNLSLLSEQASLSQESITSRTKQRSLARRQQLLAAKRSPRPRHSGLDDMDAAGGVSSPSNDEVSLITTAQRISPTKILRSAPARPPRQPKHNFRIEEELAEIEDQDERIAYLVKKMTQIRSLYSDVKSNLTSIERKRKRVRQRRDREQISHGVQD